MAREPGRGRADIAVDPTLAQKKRARHRLVGAIALCLLAALLIPLILEAEPRQKPREVPLEIAARSRPVQPDAVRPPPSDPVARAGDAAADGSRAAAPTDARSSVKPVDAGAAGAVAAPAARPMQSEKSSGAATGTTAAGRSADNARPGTAADGARAAATPPRGDAKPDARPAPRPEGDPLAAIISRTDPARDLASTPRKDAVRRYLVQVGAYSSIESARAVSDRVVSSGLRPYQETIRTDKGEWIRVRIGPFENRESAEQALRNLKAAGVSAALMTL